MLGFRSALLVVAVTACASEDASPKLGPVAQVHGWTLDTAASTDPFPAHRPDAVACTPAMQYPEATALEVETEFCNYFVATQPLMADVAAGDALSLSLWHAQLVAPEAAVGHIALAIGDDLVWETEIAIPNSPQIHHEVVVAPAAASAGTPVTFHLHNHGYNAWYFADVAFAGANP